jgi:hypothetical protein
MNKLITLKNNTMALIATVVGFGLCLSFVPALYSGKPATSVNNLWFSPNL